MKLGGLARPKVLLTVIVVVVVAMLVVFAIAFGLYGTGEEVPGDRGDVFP